MKLSELPQVQRASPAEKLALIDELWSSIEPDALPTPASHVTELNRRSAAFARQPARALTPAAARRRIRQVSGL